MDYKKSSLLLKKISSLYKTLHENDDHASDMEKQLMKSYLTDFYDAFVSGDGDTDLFRQSAAAEVKASPSQMNQAQKPEAPQSEIAQAKTPQAEVLSPIAEKIKQPVIIVPEVIAPQVLQDNQTEKPIATPQVQSNFIEPVTEKTPTIQPNLEPIPIENKTPEAITDKEMNVDAKEIIKQNITNPVDTDLLALFEDNPVTDLSDKLSMLPIKDLTKALSINEKFFTIQQLFGGDSQVFEQTLRKLNDLSSFDEASSELIQSVASQFEWAEESKKKKAGQFIKLVKRRYQA